MAKFIQGPSVSLVAALIEKLDQLDDGSLEALVRVSQPIACHLEELILRQLTSRLQVAQLMPREALIEEQLDPVIMTERPAEAAVDALISLDLLLALAGSLGPGVGIVGGRLMLGDGLLGTGDESPVIAHHSLIHVAKIAPELLLGSGVAKLDLSLLLDDHHRDASVNGGKQLGLILGSDPVRERGELMMELLPEFDAVIDLQLWRVR